MKVDGFWTFPNLNPSLYINILSNRSSKKEMKACFSGLFLKVLPVDQHEAIGAYVFYILAKGNFFYVIGEPMH